ncbi:MAG: methionine synthase [Lawsonibacter sp.]|jgi:hypothetical protein
MSIAINQLNIDEVLRYMGCPPEQADETTRVFVQTCAQDIRKIAQPRWAYRVLTVSEDRDGLHLEGGLLLPGRDLAKHLQGCHRVALFCATLGAGVDGIIRQAQSVDLARAFALDCCAAAAVEAVCDEVEKNLQEMFPGCFFPFRFSPGYGDLPLALQNELLALLDAPRRVGLTATASHILIPRKSVTAFLGISERPVEQKARSCLGCPAMENCQYRKSGGHCGIS